MPDSNATARALLRLTPRLQRYAWGDPDFLPQMLGVPRDGGPWAEAWYGAHPVAPASAEIAGQERSLSSVIAANANAILGDDVASRFGGLPYLLKILAAERPLSIQVHPNQAQARAGYEREQAEGIPIDAPTRRYRDPNHKPELLVALTEFDALCGFRDPSDMMARLEVAPEILGLLGPIAGPLALRTWVDAWFALPDETARPALEAMLDRLRQAHGRDPHTPEHPAYWVLRAHEVLSPSRDPAPDRGLVFVLLLEHVRLQPGQAMFLPAGVPHAYLRGTGVELMASSDNVLRAGLTPKHVDAAELLKVVRFDAGAPPILEPVEDEAGEEGTYAVPAAELDLRRIRLHAGRSVVRTAHGPETLLAVPDGANETVKVSHNGEELELQSGQACLVPHGERYELRASGKAVVFRVRMPGGEPAEIFAGRRPTPLSFGTSGLRGLVTDITDLEAYVNTRGFLDYVVATGDAVPGTAVALGGDLRPSTDSPERSILRAVSRAVQDSGLKSVHCGRLPTPALTYFGLQRGWPSIMVTGSHIPFDRNGIKFNKSEGEVLKSDEAGILAAVQRVRAREYGRARAGSLFADDGSFAAGRKGTLSAATDDARQEYVSRYLDAFGAGALQGLRIALYEHSAVGREVVAEILRGLGAQVLPVGRSETFVAIDTEAISMDQLELMQRLADQARDELGGLDAVVSTDGDSDRPLVLGVEEDQRVRFIGGDVLGAIVAEYLGADAIAVPVSSNDLIDRHFVPRGVQVVRTRIGSPWVIAAMQTLGGERKVGWEANGGFMTGSVIELEHGRLPPLPTRDAVLPIVASLQAARTAETSLSALVRRLPARFSHAGLLDEVPTSTSRALVQRLRPELPGLRRVGFGGTGVRAFDIDGDELLLGDGPSQRVLEIRDVLTRHFGSECGFGPIEEIDYLDGIRIRFEGGDVAHIRPSGNAPQLRIYALADTPERAAGIVELALADPSGILRALVRQAV